MREQGWVAMRLAVVGASGGVGASTFSCVVARRAQRRGISTALVDLRPWSGGLDFALGAEAEPGLR